LEMGVGSLVDKRIDRYKTDQSVVIKVDGCVDAIATLDNRITNVEQEIQEPTGLLQQAIKECHLAAAMSDQAAIELGGEVFCSEGDAMALIQVFPFTHKYQVFFGFFEQFLLIDPAMVNDYIQNMAVIKAATSAYFPNSLVAKMNTVHQVLYPPILCKVNAEGAIVWAPGFKTWAAFSAGGLKPGGRQMVRSHLAKLWRSCRQALTQKLPPTKYRVAHSVACLYLSLGVNTLTSSWRQWRR